MKCCYLDKPIYKDVVIVGNGPSGICLSLLLDGWTPFITSTQHPDEFLSNRLEMAIGDAEASGHTSEYGLPLVHTDLLKLARGLDGRTTNPVSLLYDALMRPYADMGMNIPPLVKWRRTGRQFANYGHRCEVESKLKELKVFQQSTNPIIRFWYNIRRVNEVSWEGNQFLRSQLITDNEHYKHVKYIFLIHPYSEFRMIWEVFMSIIFLLEFITIPLELASLQGQGTHKLHKNLAFVILRFTLDSLCVCDIIMNFFTGYINNLEKVVIMEPLKIIKRYVQTYFAVDLCSSIPGSVIAHLFGRSADPNSLLNVTVVNMFETIVVHISMFKIVRLFSFLHYCRHFMKIDHLVLGKGPPGGSWHSMDPQILTLSLASWMALPGLPFITDDTKSTTQLRASAQQVASYYENYVKQMDLKGYFRSNVIVTQIRPVEEKCSIPPMVEERESEWVHRIEQRCKQTICTSPEYCDFVTRTLRRRRLGVLASNGEQLNARPSCVVRRKICELIELSNEVFNIAENRFSARKDSVKEAEDRGRSLEEDVDDVCVDCLKERAQAHSKSGSNRFCGCLCNRENNYRRSTKKRKEGNEVAAQGRGDNRCNDGWYNKVIVPKNNQNKQRPKWLVDIYDKTSRVTTTYACNTLVLANGAHDLPNKLSLHRPKQREGADDGRTAPAEPNWLLHDVRSLEIELDLCLESAHSRQIGRRNDGGDNKRHGIQPVLVVGAGLSAADAILATRKRNIPVLHVFRSKSSDLIKKLPENMYPEYHKIHRMMISSQSGISSNYTAFPAHTISAIDASTNTVTIVDQHTNQQTTHRVSFAAVLIGSRPDLGFLPPGYKLGTRKTVPVDSKTNTVNIDRGRHAVCGFEGLYAVGPLAGDNFVRFLPGGCLAVVADVYRKRGVNVNVG